MSPFPIIRFSDCHCSTPENSGVVIPRDIAKDIAELYANFKPVVGPPRSLQYPLGTPHSVRALIREVLEHEDDLQRQSFLAEMQWRWVAMNQRPDQLPAGVLPQRAALRCREVRRDAARAMYEFVIQELMVAPSDSGPCVEVCDATELHEPGKLAEWTEGHLKSFLAANRVLASEGSAVSAALYDCGIEVEDFKTQADTVDKLQIIYTTVPKKFHRPHSARSEFGAASSRIICKTFAT